MRVPNWVLAAGLTSVVAMGAGSSWASGSGGGGGSATSTVTQTASAPSAGCVSITNFKNTTGYYAIYAAIWTDFTISNKCGVPLDWRMDYTNSAGVVEFSRGTSTQYMSSGTIDDDWAKFSSNYTVSLTVRSSTGVQLAQNKAGVTTKKPKDLIVAATAAANSADAAAAAAYSVYTAAFDAAEAAQLVADADHAKVAADVQAFDLATSAAIQPDLDAATAAAAAATATANANSANDALTVAQNNLAAGGDPLDPVLLPIVVTAQAAADAANLLATSASADAANAAAAALPYDSAVTAAAAIEATDSATAATSSAAAATAAATRDAAYATYDALHQAALAAAATVAALLAAGV